MPHRNQFVLHNDFSTPLVLTATDTLISSAEIRDSNLWASRLR